MDKLKEYEQKDEKFANAIEEFIGDCYAYTINSHYSSMIINLLEKMLSGDSEDDTLSYWYYELNCGEGKIETANGTIYKLKSLKDVYDYYKNEVNNG